MSKLHWSVVPALLAAGWLALAAATLATLGVLPVGSPDQPRAPAAAPLVQDDLPPIHVTAKADTDDRERPLSIAAQ